MDSEDFAALDFLVGAIADGAVGVGRRCLDAVEIVRGASVRLNTSWTVAQIRFRVRWEARPLTLD